MHDLTRLPATDPSSIYRSRDQLYADDMLIAALTGLDFFSWLDAHPGTVEDIAESFGFHPRPVDVMTTLFVAMELLRRSGDVLELTERSREHLVNSSPWFLGPYFPKPDDRPIARDLIEILRSGRPANFASRKTEADWHRAMETESFAEEFTAAMDCRGLWLGPALATQLDLSGRRRLLDIAGGSGVYACALVARLPNLQAAVLEKPPVDQISTRAIGRRGFAGRVNVVAGDILKEPLPSGYDVHLFSNVLHDWDVPVVQQLLSASAAAIAPGGLVILHDAFLNARKDGPLNIAAYSVLLMHVTQGRCYSVAEMASWLNNAGFETPSEVPTGAGRSALVARRQG
jgi:SAM-dependent methyltransferase